MDRVRRYAFQGSGGPNPSLTAHACLKCNPSIGCAFAPYQPLRNRDLLWVVRRLLRHAAPSNRSGYMETSLRNSVICSGSCGAGAEASMGSTASMGSVAEQARSARSCSGAGLPLRRFRSSLSEALAPSSASKNARCRSSGSRRNSSASCRIFRSNQATDFVTAARF